MVNIVKKYENESDSTLVEMTLLGHNDAFEELVLRHERAVTGTAMKITRNSFSAEDAAQDAFVAAWMKLDSLRDASRFSSFVCSIAKNCAIDLHRRYYCACPDVSLNLLENEDLDRQTEEAQQDEEEYARLREEVEALGKETRDVIKAHYFEGLSVREIASKLGCPEGTVKWRLSEGRKLLRKGYGIVEKEYNENEALVRRVMRQVEELKLWTLKNDKTGFETDYRAALSAVEALEESSDKHHALADVLLRGYWWLPGEKNGEVLKRVKDSAEKGRNDDAMMFVVANEAGSLRGQKKIDFLFGEELPYLEKIGFVKTQAYVWFWAGREYMSIDLDKAKECFEKAKSLLHPIDVYYANAVAALRILPRVKGDTFAETYVATGETIRLIDNKPYFWAQPGFGPANGSIFYYAGEYNDRLLLDETLKVGETRIASDGFTRCTLVSDDVTVETPAGRFTHCLRFTIERQDTFVESDYAKGVGVVRQRVKEPWNDPSDAEWLLSSYLHKGGEGYLPFATGNVWEYVCQTKIPGETEDNDPDRYEVIGMSEDAISVAHSYYHLRTCDLECWEGAMKYAAQNYVDPSDELHDVLPYIEKAEKLAATRRQKVHTEIAGKVMRRILETHPETNPGYTEYGRWDFFRRDKIAREGANVRYIDSYDDFCFEEKEMIDCGVDGYPVLHNFLYDMLSDATGGFLWKDGFTPGAHFDLKDLHYDDEWTSKIDVAPETERVETPAGVFENCLKLTYDLKGAVGGYGYRGGVKHYWFAPGVGIVQMKAPYGSEGQYTSHWALTEYRGRGEGYFPCGDGFFRRYEAQNLKNGWHGAVEYTFLEDEEGLTLFRDALGTQERANYEADKAKE